jgi:mono/diheme cytochrome c family protein
VARVHRKTCFRSHLVRVALAGGALAAGALAAMGGVAAGIEGTNVPDAVTRESGLKLVPMSHPQRIYALNCQGCHGEAGVSVSEIPTLAGRIGYFARIPEGRRYLIQVPNVALNPSSDEDIAELMNWVLMTFSRAELPEDFHPYTAEEVGQLRKDRIDPRARRQYLIEQLLAAHWVPSADVLAMPRTFLY